jgi:hypothetical protein
VVLVCLASAPAMLAVEAPCPGGSNPDSRVIWCDDFDDSTPVASKYWEYDSHGGGFVKVAGKGLGGTSAMQAVWQTGEDFAGTFWRTFGRSPVSSQSHSTQDFREVYWRMYVRMAPGWSGNPMKLSRATSFAASSWAQAMIAHVWGDPPGDSLMIDSATGINSSGQLVTTTYNDFDHLMWIGAVTGTTPIFSSAAADRWYCIEAHAKLNTAGSSDGTFDLWIDGRPEANKAGLNWVGTWSAYGINAVAFENYWNGGAPGPRTRYFDNIVIATRPIGCLPQAPTGLRIVR